MSKRSRFEPTCEPLPDRALLNSSFMPPVDPDPTIGIGQPPVFIDQGPVYNAPIQPVAADTNGGDNEYFFTRQSSGLMSLGSWE